MNQPTFAHICKKTICRNMQLIHRYAKPKMHVSAFFNYAQICIVYPSPMPFSNMHKYAMFIPIYDYMHLCTIYY